MKKIVWFFVLMILSSCSSKTSYGLIPMDIEESSWVRARYKDVFSEYNIEEYLDFDELYIDCFSCSVKYDNSFCNKIKLYTDQV